MTARPQPTVLLRPVQQTDAPAVLRAFASSDDMARQGVVTTADEAQTYVDRLIAAGGPHRAFAIDVGATLVGLVTVSIDTANRNGWFWYWMHIDHRAHGLTSEAAATVAQWALTDGGCERLELGHRADNPASRGVAMAAGFVQEGCERAKFLIDGQRIDVLTYGRLQSDPEPATERLPLRAP